MEHIKKVGKAQKEVFFQYACTSILHFVVQYNILKYHSNIFLYLQQRCWGNNSDHILQWLKEKNLGHSDMGLAWKNYTVRIIEWWAVGQGIVKEEIY